MIREGYMPFMGRQTYYRIVGEKSEKPALVLLHGGPGSTHNYFEVLDALSEKDGRMLVMYDQIGCGNSYVDGHPEYWVESTWIEELIALRKHLQLDECHILGQSWGGMMLLTYLCSYPHSGVKSAILSSTLPASWLWGQEQARMIKELPEEYQEAIRKATQSGDYSGEVYQKAEDEFMARHCSSVDESTPECVKRPKKTGREAYVTAWGPNEFTPLGTLKDFDVIRKLPNIKEPALIISGGNDLCTPYIAKTMFDGIPNSRWELFQNCRHSCFVEDTARYTELLMRWLNEHD